MVIPAERMCKMKTEYLLIAFLIGMCSVLVVLCLMIFKSVQPNSIPIENSEINKEYPDREDYILDYEKTGGIVFEPKTGRITVLEKPAKGKVWKIMCDDGFIYHVQIDSSTLKEENKQDKFTGGILCGFWGAITIDPDNYSLKYYLLSPEAHQVSEKEFKKAQNERE